MVMGIIVNQEFEFVEITNSANEFFEILPQDWQELIAVNWQKYANKAQVLALKHHNKIVAGGVVFLGSHPGESALETAYYKMFSTNYKYLGFIWVPIDERNKNYASKWLTCLKEENPKQKYWLTIEEESLKYFYKKNGFKLIENENNSAIENEWVLVYSPN
jgi:hypothetical protein